MSLDADSNKTRGAQPTANAAAERAAAHVLLIVDDPVRLRERSRQFSDLGVRVTEALGVGGVVALAQSERPDLVLVEKTSEAPSFKESLRALKSEPAISDVPLVVVADIPSDSLFVECLAEGVDDLIVRPLSMPAMIARLAPLFRLSAIRAEWRRRIATVWTLGAVPSVKLPSRDPSSHVGTIVTVAGESDLNDSLAPLAAAGFTIERAPNLFSAQDLVSTGNADVLVLHGKGDAEQEIELAEQTRRNPRLFDLPVVLIAELDDFHETAAHRRGVTVRLTDYSDPLELRFTIETLVRRERLRKQMKSALRTALKDVGSDKLTGLPNTDYLDAYIRAVTQEASQNGKPVTIAAFDVANLKTVAEEHGPEAGAALFRQLGHWMDSLVRAEDLLGRVGEHEFVVVLPQTGIGDARFAVDRIAGVIMNTDYVVPGVDHEVRVWLEYGVAAAKPGDSLATALVRTRATRH
ncbi:MAG: diguanylate cyclase [Alphaproteobacteria bacterium]